MALFSKKSSVPATHRIDIHFAQPMTVRLRQQHEQEIIDELLPAVKATGRVVMSATAITEVEEPISSDMQLEISCSDLSRVADVLRQTLTDNGIARGSWIDVDGERTELGSSEYVLLRTRLAEESDADLEPTVLALHRALGDGAIGWHEDVYFRYDGPVFVFNGDSASQIVHALEMEMKRQPLLAKAEIVSVTQGAG